jgi:predicted ferric reductase
VEVRAGALVKRFPYRWFFKTHWLLFVPTYLVLVFHAVALFDSRYWLTPLGPVLAVVVIAGAGAGIVRLLHSFEVVDDRAIGEIVGLTFHDVVRTLLVEV